MVMAVILFMGNVSGAHLNPAVSLAFAARGDFPWRRVPGYVLAQLAGAVLATLALWAFVGRHGGAGLALPGPGIPTASAMLWEALLTCGLVSVILGTASGAQQLGPIAAIGVGSYIALAGLFGAPVSGASMNPARSLGPALVLADWTSWWAYLRPADRRRRSRWASPISCAVPAAAQPAPTRPRAPWARSGSPAASARPTPPPATTAHPARPKATRPVRPGPRPVRPVRLGSRPLPSCPGPL